MPYNCCLQWWSARLIRERQSLWPFCVRASGPICPTLPPPPARHYGKQFIKKVFLFNLFGQCWPPLSPLQLHISSASHCLYHGANILIDNQILTSGNEQILNNVALKFLAQDKICNLSCDPPPPPTPAKMFPRKFWRTASKKVFIPVTFCRKIWTGKCHVMEM